MQLDLLSKDSREKQEATAQPQELIVDPDQPLPQELLDAALPIATEQEDDEDNDKEKAPGAFRTISEAAKFLGVPQHVLRFWESRFAQIKPLKMRGGRRYYRPEDMETLGTIKHLLYKQGYTIKGAKKAFASTPPVQRSPHPPINTASGKVVTADRKHSQLAVIRQELIGMRETLKAYL